MAIIALLMGFLLPNLTAAYKNKDRTETTLKLKNIETAIYNFVIANKRLPCPANGSATPATGLEDRPGSGLCNNNQANGVVPWTTLGLSFADVLDNWGNQITFRIGYGLAVTAALDMSSCDPAGTAATIPASASAPNINVGLCATATCTGTFSAASCTSPLNFLIRKGLDVSDGASKFIDYTSNSGGAGFVLISHGENGYGAMTNTQTYQPNASRAVAGTTLEAPNIDAALSITSGAPPQIVDAPFSDSDDATKRFDDVVIRPTLQSVINTAQLGPRIH
jgi:type II secretory pathway pseudopilin PulG